MKQSEVIAVVGGQWGDEGKGKIVDYLAADADVVIRSQGGDNAGHTVMNDRGKFGLHLVPAGIFNDSTLNIIGAGVALNVKTLIAELAELKQQGVSGSNLLISPKAHLTFEYHRFIDAHLEALRGAGKIGTTKKGIGPTYMDKAERVGLPARLLLHPDKLLKQLDTLLLAKRKLWNAYDNEVFEAEYYESLITEASSHFKAIIRDTESVLDEHLRKGSRFVLEGAHGALLDIDHGTYPMVTASNSTVGGLLVGAGLPPLALTKVVGIFKAYQTRVGEGAMPTELLNDIGDTIREKGHEFGTTTGRPRRIGYFDGVAARYAHRINGFTDIAITRVDTLAGTEDLKVCTEYTKQGVTTDFTVDDHELAACKPTYAEYQGWQESELEHAEYADFPETVRSYCDAIIASMPGAKLSFVGVGQARDQLKVIS